MYRSGAGGALDELRNRRTVFRYIWPEGRSMGVLVKIVAGLALAVVGLVLVVAVVKLAIVLAVVAVLGFAALSVCRMVTGVARKRLVGTTAPPPQKRVTPWVTVVTEPRAGDG